MAKDLILDDNNDLEIANGDFVIGISLEQEVALIVGSNQGEWKSDPLLGCNLVQMINGRAKETEVEKRVRIQLERDGKNYDEVKKQLNYDLQGTK